MPMQIAAIRRSDTFSGRMILSVAEFGRAAQQAAGRCFHRQDKFVQAGGGNSPSPLGQRAAAAAE
jgi:hypothetical protein